MWFALVGAAIAAVVVYALGSLGRGGASPVRLAVRRWRPDVAEVDLQVVLHDEEGPGCRWARGAQPGDPVALWGPRTIYRPPAGTTHYLLVGDDTALPAIGAILETLPAGTSVEAIIEVEDRTDQQPLALRDGQQVTWLHRDGSPPAQPELLLEAVRGLALPSIGLYAWGGAESRVVTAVRRHLRSSSA